MAGALSRVPGLGGFLEAGQLGQQQQLGQLQQLGAVQGILARAQQQKQQAAALQRDEQLRGVLAQLPQDATPEMVTRAITPYAAPDVLLRTFQASADRAAQRENTAAMAAAAQAERKAALEARLADARTSREEQANLRRELAEMNNQARADLLRLVASLRPPQQPAAAQLHTDPEGNLWERNRDGTWKRAATPDGKPIGGSAAGGAGGVGGVAPSAPAGGTAITPGLDLSQGTGGSGFFGGMANTISDMFGANLPQPGTEQATQALNNLQVQTITTLQDAVPGRPSNYLMQQMEKLAVKPGSLFMGDNRAKERLSQTRAMLATEVARMEREVLNNPRQYTAAELTKTRRQHGQIRQLMNEYDTALKSFGTSKNVPPPPVGFTIDSP